MAFIERNWANNVAYRAARYHEPTTVDELCSVVAAATKVRANPATRYFISRCRRA